MNAFDHYALGCAYAREQRLSQMSASEYQGVPDPYQESPRLSDRLLDVSEVQWLAFEARELGDTESEEFWNGYCAVVELTNVEVSDSKEVAA